MTTTTFDWQTFCRSHGVPFVTVGPNVARNDINVRCPLCGDDPSEHMGLSKDPRKPWWSCWRNPEHRGRDPTRLVMALLRCSRETAEATVRVGDLGAIDRYEGLAARIAGTDPPASAVPTPRVQSLHMPREFRPITGTGYGRQFYDYLLLARGFTQVRRLVERYDLRYCLAGHFRQRVVIPIYEGGELVSWTARDITGQSQVRYRTLSDDPEKARDQGYPPATINLKATVLNADLAKGGETLFVCEGPFDAIKLDWFVGASSSAVALFGMPEMQQEAILRRLARSYRRLLVVLDQDAKAKALKFVEQLRGVCGVPTFWQELPEGVKDPGELTARMCRTLGKSLVLRGSDGSVNMSVPVQPVRA